MCNQKTKDGKQCMLSPYKDICHVHQKQQEKALRDLLTKDTEAISEVDLLKNEIINLKNINNDINAKYSKLKSLYDDKIEEHSDCYIKDNKIMNLKISNQDLMTKLQNEINKNNKLYNQIKNMKEDYNSYQIIKKYERQKKYLSDNQLKADQNFHKLRLERNNIVHQKVLL